MEELVTVREQAYTGIRQAIIAGEFRPGERLPELTLSEKFGIARTAVREALSQLERDGLVSRRSGLGVMVAHYDEKRILGLRKLRSCLECLAAREAAENCTPVDAARLAEMVAASSKIGTDFEHLSEFQHYDEMFHLHVAEIARIPLLRDILQNQRVLIQLLSAAHDHIPVSDRTESRVLTLGEHRRLAALISEHKADEAERLMLAHVLRT